MAHAQKPDFVFPWNGRVHLNRWGRQFSRLLAAELCASAVVMLDKPRSEGVWEYWLPTPFASFPFTSPPVRHRVPPGSERALTLGDGKMLPGKDNRWVWSNDGMVSGRGKANKLGEGPATTPILLATNLTWNLRVPSQGHGQKATLIRLNSVFPWQPIPRASQWPLLHPRLLNLETKIWGTEK